MKIEHNSLITLTETGIRRCTYVGDECVWVRLTQKPRCYRYWWKHV